MVGGTVSRKASSGPGHAGGVGEPTPFVVPAADIAVLADAVSG